MTARVLIVDDSLTVRMGLAETFAAAGFDAVPCDTLGAARAALAAKPCQLVILDVQLPDGDGIDLLIELRRAADTAKLPIFLLSSESEVKHRIRGLTGGADAYLAKPYDAAQLVERAERLLATQVDDPRPLVLVIDDSVTFREEIAARLGEAGFRVLAAASGEEGLRRAADVRPAAIVVDGVMPGIDGTAVIRTIRLDPALSATPCLMLTASEGAASEVTALDAGADGYVRKSEGSELILVRLRALLRAGAKPRPDGPSAFGPKKILAVDDSRTYLELLGETLHDDGHDVVKAHSGAEALAVLGVEAVYCVLLDLFMPGLSGTETCQRIKATPALRNVPLIMLTASEDQQTMIDGINAGADDYVTKSADFAVLKARLRAQLRRKQVEDETRRVREQFLQKETEANAARALAEQKTLLLGQLETKNAELAAVNRELETFAYSVSHDLRQPLRSIDGFSKVLLEEHAGGLPPDARHYLERVRAGAQRMAALIDGLLALSRVTQSELVRRPLRLDAIARRVFQRLSDGDPGRAAELDIDGEILAQGDPQLIESVLENLIGNAWKFTAHARPARLAVGVACEPRRAFYVRDNGVGFQMEYAGKLFGPFQRLHSDKQFAGTGIGLATVQRIVHRHGGEIWAESRPGEGSTFYFTLPAEAAP